MQSVYDGSASFGVFTSEIAFYSSLFIGFIMFLCVIYLIYSDFTSEDIKGVIKSVKKNDSENSINTSYIVSVQYTYKGITKIDTTTTTQKYEIGDKVNIIRNDDGKIEIDSSKKLLLASVLCCIALIIILFSYIRMYLTKRYKFFAAFEGVSNGVDMAERIF